MRSVRSTISQAGTERVRYNYHMPEERIYTPELLPRQGELNAWLLTVASAFGLYFLSLRSELLFWAWFLFIILAFSAISISLGNWMDRKTVIRIKEDGISFENGLRKTNLTWDAIREVRTAPAHWGISVQVIGKQGHFAFSTLGEMQFQGRVRARTGFSAGQEILDELIRSAGLIKKSQNGQFLTYSRT